MELAESGAIGTVVATKRDRLFRSRLYRLLAEQDLAEYGVELVALNDTGNRLADGFQDEFAEYEREQITQRTMAGKLQKAREGKIVAGRLPVYGFSYTPDRDHYEVDEAKMAAVRRLFALIASGLSVSATTRTLTEEGFPAPAGLRWQRPTVREIVLDDSYRPHTHGEISALVRPEVSARLDPSEATRYGVWWYNRREVVKTRRGKRIRKKPRSEWIAVPVPDAGVPRKTVEAARAAIEDNLKTSSRGRREWQLSGGILRCAECGCTLVAHGSTRHYPKQNAEISTYHRHYYRCATYRRLGRHSPEGCAMNRNLHAPNTEEWVWQRVRGAMLDPRRLQEAIRRYQKRKAPKTDRRRLSATLARLDELQQRRDGLIDLAADGLLPKTELAERLAPLNAQIGALRDEAEAIRGAEERERAKAEDARLLARGLSPVSAEDLDALTSAQRRELYKRLGLTVMAHRDGSLTITWFVDIDLGELRCQEEGTSTR